MHRFLYILMGLTALAHVAPAIGVTELARRLGASQPWLWSALLLVLGVALFLGRARAGIADTHRPGWMVNLIDQPYYVHWTACLFTLVPSLVACIVCWIGGFSLSAAFMWIYLVGLVVCGYGVLIRRRFFVIRRIEVPITGLDAAFDGYRIVQLSDMHIGAMTPRSWGERWVRAANRLAPDLTVVTGDMVTNGIEFHHDIADIVGGLEAKDGVFVSMGNHDYFGEGEPLATLITERGARVLRNEGLVLEREDGKLYLAAIDDTWTRRDDMDRALSERPEGMRTVLMSHDPDRFREAAKRDVDLVLSGHTHGGQIALPFFAEHVTLSRLTHHYHLGVYNKGQSTLYVHPGLGTTGPPIRLGVAPAIAIITLRAV
jgi:predicted MPP superfamily phosphohydrolase